MSTSTEPSEAIPARPHTCHARDCTIAVPPERLMCPGHWRQVPKAIQRAVWAAYRPGQCELSPAPSKAWHLAADAAIAAVALGEGKLTADAAVRWLERHGPVDAALVMEVRRCGRS